MKVSEQLLRLAGSDAGDYKFVLSTTGPGHPAGVMMIYRRGGFIVLGTIQADGREHGTKKGRPFDSILEAGRRFEGGNGERLAG